MMLFDELQSHAFWLMDVSFSGVPVFLPVLGFSKCSAPEMTTTFKEVKAGNWAYKKHVVKEITVSPLRIQRGAKFFDAEFYRWAQFCATGVSGSNFLGNVQGESPRKNLLLVQFFRGIPFVGSAGGTLSQVGAGIAAAAGLAGALVGAGGAGALALSPVLAASAAFVGVGRGSFALRVPARAWLMQKCLVSRFKAASDFDASNADVSEMELDIQPHLFEEFSMSA